MLLKVFIRLGFNTPPLCGGEIYFGIDMLNDHPFLASRLLYASSRLFSPWRLLAFFGIWLLA
jgi:hypothetical protein